ncbi:MAG: hypothetical protein E7311_02115 [Clostridiales bacterium]|nr:hypothetical protein [Clostridiales bacterium]
MLSNSATSLLRQFEGTNIIGIIPVGIRDGTKGAFFSQSDNSDCSEYCQSDYCESEYCQSEYCQSEYCIED